MGFVLTMSVECEATISLWRITEGEDQLAGITDLPTSKLQDINNIKSEHRRKEILATIALVRRVFGKHVLYDHYENGRPYLTNLSAHISISHTKEYIAIISHPNMVVGIDIESLNRSFSAVEKKALSINEINNLSNLDRNLHLAIHWSIKEAVYKFLSINDVDFASQIDISKFSPNNNGVAEVLFTNRDGSLRNLNASYMIYEDHVIAWIV